MKLQTGLQTNTFHQTSLKSVLDFQMKKGLGLETEYPTDTTILKETSQSLFNREKTIFETFFTHYAGFDAE